LHEARAQPVLLASTGRGDGVLYTFYAMVSNESDTTTIVVDSKRIFEF